MPPSNQRQQPPSPPAHSQVTDAEIRAMRQRQRILELWQQLQFNVVEDARQAFPPFT